MLIIITIATLRIAYISISIHRVSSNIILVDFYFNKKLLHIYFYWLCFEGAAVLTREIVEVSTSCDDETLEDLGHDADLYDADLYDFRNRAGDQRHKNVDIISKFQKKYC